MPFSLGELFLMIVVAIIVVGPKRLPGMMRTAGQWVSRLRRMSTDLRSQSGIDDLLRQEGLTQHLNELRSLSRFNVVETLMASPAPAPGTPATRMHAPLDQPARPALAPALTSNSGRMNTWRPDEPLREREYPLIGCDAYSALPDSAVIYVPALAKQQEAAATLIAETVATETVPQTPPADVAPADAAPLDAPVASPSVVTAPVVTPVPEVHS